MAVRQGTRSIQKENGWHRFVAMQNHYNLVYREEEREMNPLCIDNGVGLIPWSPLARGFLAGNRDKVGSGPTARAKTDDFAKNMYFREYDFEVLSVVEQIAKERSITPSQVAWAWILQAPESALRSSARPNSLISRKRSRRST